MEATCGNHKGELKTGGLYRENITKISGQNSDGDIVLQADALNIREGPCPYYIVL